MLLRDPSATRLLWSRAMTSTMHLYTKFPLSMSLSAPSLMIPGIIS